MEKERKTQGDKDQILKRKVLRESAQNYIYSHERVSHLIVNLFKKTTVDLRYDHSSSPP